MSTVLTGGGYSVTVDPACGGAILSASWAGGGDDIALLAPWDESLPPFKAGCFAMVPFANRIADGRFNFEGRDYVLPVNRPEENVAIHGFSREHEWVLTKATETSVVLEQDFAQDGNPYRYHAHQEIGLSEGGIRVALSVRNDGADKMPFGIGLHPWFLKTPQTRLAFYAEGAFRRDARGLPVTPSEPEPAFQVRSPAALGSFGWFDSCFEGWSPRLARIVRPEDGIAIEVEATGALGHLHVHVPDDRLVVCAEPVSHAPDAVNRPQLGATNAMDPLAPGETLSGAMTMRAAAYPPV